VSAPFLRIGTRGSPLALAQAEETRARLCAAHGVEPAAIPLVVIRTTGDAIRDRPLSEAGGKGLFTKELDQALIEGRIDLAVHSAKDVPALMPDEVDVIGALPREDVRDALISRGGVTSLGEVSQGALMGSASLRRQAQLLRARPDLRVVLLRGNVETRLRKVEVGEIEGTLLAMAGLNRLGLAHRAAGVLDTDAFLPAAGQGAIAIAARARDTSTRALIEPVLDELTTIALGAERAFIHRLDGSCRTPLAGLAEVTDGLVVFRGELLSPDGRQHVRAERAGSVADAAKLGDDAAREILDRAPSGLVVRPGEVGG